MRVTKWLLTLAAVAAVVPTQLEAQVTRLQADTSTCTPTARQLRQVAAAVDGYKRGEQLWVVSTCGDSSEVVGVFMSEAEAREVARIRKATWVVRNSATVSAVLARLALMDTYTLECHHDQQLSVWLPPRQCGVEVLPQADVASVTIQFRLRNGTTISRPVPLNADVMFLKYSGIEKFAFTYYERILGAEGVAATRDEIFARRRAAQGRR